MPTCIYHPINFVSACAYVSEIPVNLTLRILPKLKGLVQIKIFFKLTLIDLTLWSMKNDDNFFSIVHLPFPKGIITPFALSYMSVDTLHTCMFTVYNFLQHGFAFKTYTYLAGLWAKTTEINTTQVLGLFSFFTFFPSTAEQYIKGTTWLISKQQSNMINSKKQKQLIYRLLTFDRYIRNMAGLIMFAGAQITFLLLLSN